MRFLWLIAALVAVLVVVAVALKQTNPAKQTSQANCLSEAGLEHPATATEQNADAYLQDAERAAGYSSGEEEAEELEPSTASGTTEAPAPGDRGEAIDTC